MTTNGFGTVSACSHGTKHTHHNPSSRASPSVTRGGPLPEPHEILSEADLDEPFVRLVELEFELPLVATLRRRALSAEAKSDRPIVDLTSGLVHGPSLFDEPRAGVDGVELRATTPLGGDECSAQVADLGLGTLEIADDE
jgi:hypothetical protein